MLRRSAGRLGKVLGAHAAHERAGPAPERPDRQRLALDERDRQPTPCTAESRSATSA
jgi:hypothetical protein